MAYPLNPMEYRLPPHGAWSQQDDARLATPDFNFNNFLPYNPGPPPVGSALNDVLYDPGSNYSGSANRGVIKIGVGF